VRPPNPSQTGRSSLISREIERRVKLGYQIHHKFMPPREIFSGDEMSKD
jgi:hypothetical protein